ncbi:MAG: teichoic acid transporter permease [Burkholderiales bacterium]|nr:teichoic acid transporter permease [Burkholderiales bacterium]
MKLAILAIKNRRMLLNLITSDFKNRYLGNHLGIVWAFIQPLVMVAVYWLVFTRGFRVAAVSKGPFLLWLLAGMVPWFLLSDSIVSASSAVTSQAFLVKKIVFEVKLLPFVKIGSAVLVNLAFWLLMIIICLCYGYFPSVWWLQLIYYMFCILCISLSISLFCSSVMPFLPDLGQIIAIVFQVLFWATPIMWDQNMLHNKAIYLVKLNPFAYIINGFRDTLIDHTPFWLHYYMMLYFWVFTVIVYLLGNRTFNKLRPHFADVL